MKVAVMVFLKALP